MKNSGILGLVILFAVSCSDNKYNVEIRGNVTDAPPKNTTVYIEDMNTAKPRITDSAVIKSGGKFKLRLKTKGPGFYHLGIGHKNILLLGILYAGFDLVNKERTFQNHRLRQPNPWKTLI